MYDLSALGQQPVELPWIFYDVGNNIVPTPHGVCLQDGRDTVVGTPSFFTSHLIFGDPLVINGHHANEKTGPRELQSLQEACSKL